MKLFKKKNKAIEEKDILEQKISVILFSPTLEVVRTIVPILILIVQLFILMELYDDFMFSCV